MTAEPVAFDKDNPPIMYGVGSKSCGAYLDAADDPVESLAYTGFFSGYATYHGAMVGANVLKGTDFAGISHWLKNYCTANPTSHYLSAIVALIGDMTNKYNGSKRK